MPLSNLGPDDKLLSSSSTLRHARLIAEGFIATGHFGLFILATMDHLAITVPSEYTFFILVADNKIWLPINLFAFLAIALALIKNKGHITAMSISAGFMGAWGFLNLLGGLTALRPVSLAGPLLGMILSGVAYAVAMSWAQNTPRIKEER